MQRFLNYLEVPLAGICVYGAHSFSLNHKLTNKLKICHWSIPLNQVAMTFLQTLKISKIHKHTQISQFLAICNQLTIADITIATLRGQILKLPMTKFSIFTL